MNTGIIATVKGGLNTSLNIIVRKVHQVGDILDLSTIIHLVPDGISYAKFFKEYVSFCINNNSSKLYRVDAIQQTQNGCEMQVSPIV